MEHKITGLISGSKSDDLKEKLLVCIDKESAQFAEDTRAYFEKEYLSQDDRVSLLKAIISTVDHVLESGDWESSLFLRNTIKPFVAIKEEAQAELAQLESSQSGAVTTVRPPAENEMEVYISLFQSDGYNISKWAMQLRSLDRYMLGRPVYCAQADVEKRIRLRNAAGNEAYAVVIVKKSDVQSDTFGTPLKDPFDHPLLLLKETAIKNGRIAAFVHQNSRYYFVDGQLIKE